MKWKSLATFMALLLSLFFSHFAFADGIKDLPPELQELYKNLDPQQPTGTSIYKDFKPKHGPPWKIGYASTYAGNTWRAAAMDRLMKDLVPKYKAAGLISDVVVTQSDLKDSVQIQQMRQMVDQGVDAIFICCSNITAINKTVEYAYSKGVPVFSWSGYVTSPYAVSATVNITDGGYQETKWLAEEIGGKGNVLLVSGIPGFASSDSFDKGAKMALKEYPNIKLIGTVAGQWTDQVAQVEVQKFLATHPQKLDGIIIQSAAEGGVLKAVLQSGRPLMPMTLGGEAGAACYWLKHPKWVSTSFHFWPPGDEIQLVFESLIRTLEGQGPKVQSISYRVGRYSVDDVRKAVGDNCNVDSTDWIQPGPKVWFPDSVANGFFERPQDPLTWKPTN